MSRKREPSIIMTKKWILQVAVENISATTLQSVLANVLLHVLQNL